MGFFFSKLAVASLKKPEIETEVTSDGVTGVAEIFNSSFIRE